MDNRYVPLAEARGYNFVEAFAVSNTLGNVIYRGYHGFVETAQALATATGRVTYNGVAFGEIA